MYTFLAVLLTALFSGWVWTLKHELADVSRHALAGHGDPQGATHVEAMRGPAPLSLKTAASNPPPGFKGRNTSGVPVWTIDA